VVPTIYFNGRRSDLSVVDFIREKIHEDTRIVFIDAGRWNYNFEYLFACITPLYDRPPKIYIAADCTPIGKGSFSITSQWPIVFSDYYGNIHTPYADFGTMFFFGWDFEQWELTQNLIAQCVKLYSWLGVVESPVELK
jgi:hypothetical protein